MLTTISDEMSVSMLVTPKPKTLAGTRQRDGFQTTPAMPDRRNSQSPRYTQGFQEIQGEAGVRNADGSRGDASSPTNSSHLADRLADPATRDSTYAFTRSLPRLSL